MENVKDILDRFFESEEYKNLEQSLKEGCPDLQRMDRYVEATSSLSFRQLTTPFSC